MLLESYYTKSDDIIRVSADQASRFAKTQCNDFNPIHDPDNKRFCVPGDLLFSLVVNRYGVSESMSFTFTNMIGDNIGICFPDDEGEHLVITNENGKSVLEINRQGNVSHDPKMIKSLIQNYVLFSGQNFPTLLMPLLKKHDVMFNPVRPLVMYNSMSFELDTFSSNDDINVKLTDSKLDVKPKRADFSLHFNIQDGEKAIGHGIKKLIVAGLKPYEHDAMTNVLKTYEERCLAVS